jgi:hypothetical protein
MLREQKTAKAGYSCRGTVEPERDRRARSIVALETVGNDGATCTQLIEPPCTERYARWCERSGSQLMATLLLDCGHSYGLGISVGAAICRPPAAELINQTDGRAMRAPTVAAIIMVVSDTGL